MMHRHLSLKDKVIVRLTMAPECLDMREFSALGSCGTTFCLAGLILHESGVFLEYSPEGIAVGLEEGETPPASHWVDYEISLSARPVAPSRVMIAAKAREAWASEFGDEAARLLPFYGPDWQVEPEDMDQVTAEQVVELIQVINAVAGELIAAA
jgi:hypothetical protein